MRMNLTEWEFSSGTNLEEPELLVILITGRNGQKPESNIYEVRQIIHIPTAKMLVASIPVLQYEISQMIQMVINYKREI